MSCMKCVVSNAVPYNIMHVHAGYDKHTHTHTQSAHKTDQVTADPKCEMWHA
jgi:hypothetical protein